MVEASLILGTISVAPLVPLIVGVLIIVALAGWLFAKAIDGGMKHLNKRRDRSERGPD